MGSTHGEYSKRSDDFAMFVDVANPDALLSNRLGASYGADAER
jgi:hypothetical protein